MKRVAIIQARMSSSRLPGKVMKPLAGEPVLAHVYNRVSSAKNVDQVVIATSKAAEDDVIEEFCKAHNFECFRGDLNDVLSRYYEAAKLYRADVIIRITSDCPLYDGEVLTSMLEKFSKNCDYLSNTIHRTYPRGLDTEIFTFKALERAHNNASTSHEKEHVTPYIYNNPQAFIIEHFTGEEDLSHHRWTLDTPEDLALITAVYKTLGASATTDGVLEFLAQNPQIYNLNQHIVQK